MQKNNNKLFYVLISMLIFVILVFPISTNALSIEDYNIKNDLNYMVKNNNITFTSNLASWEVKHNMSGCNSSLLGNPSDPDSVAWLLQTLLNYIKVLGPILVIILSSVDFVKVIVKSDDEAMAAAQKKLGYRIILAGLLFFIPTIVQVVLNIFGITSDPTCGIQ